MERLYWEFAGEGERRREVWSGRRDREKKVVERNKREKIRFDIWEYRDFTCEE